MPVVEQKWASRAVGTRKLFAGQVSVAQSLEDDRQGRG